MHQGSEEESEKAENIEIDDIALYVEGDENAGNI